jgi:general stress protein 26
MVETALEVARNLMGSVEFCFLITLDTSGNPQARVMQPLSLEDDFRVWMATSPVTRKFQEIRRDRRATLAYIDKKGDYVTLAGEVFIREDKEVRDRLWKDEMKAFWPDGPDRGFILLEFIPSRIEVLSFEKDVSGEPKGWRPVILRRKAKGWELA